MLSVLTNGTVEECLMTLSDTYYIAVGGEFYSMFSHFCKHVVIDIGYVCDCLLSYEQLFYVWGLSHVMTISFLILKPGFKFAASLPECGLSSTNQIYFVREIIFEMSNACKPFLCKAFHFTKWVMARILSIEFGVQGKLGLEGTAAASSSAQFFSVILGLFLAV